MVFTLTIDSENAACETREDIVEMLERVVRNVSAGRNSMTVRDINGNNVGSWELELHDVDEDEEEEEV
jgi:hypothetical protein